ncbi:MAG TPA: L-glutamate gamma-semialdehyde dehydrogenase, partial [Vicinamibacterales bacterium]|nr:L-glutamate gamma-semialdehyde dehydrogenase [Vicinamibacterales bacterium]
MSLSAFNGRRRVPPPFNDPIRSYAPGTPERTALKARLKAMAGEQVEIPLIIGGKEVKTGNCAPSVMPHDHQHVLAHYHKASEQHVRQAVEAAHAAHKEWNGWTFEDRAAVILKAAELLRTSWRDTINGATMLGQSKTAFQAEIDSACEIVDFWRFNVHYGQELLEEQPISDNTMWNQVEYRGLEGFVYAVTPFNFTSIAANLPTAPALMGNTVVWKPASSAMYNAYWLMKLYEAAGMPPGVINMVAGDSAMISNILLSHRDLAGVHFTGSTEVFNDMWKTIGASMSSYRSYPRIVGETGGKDFIIAHPSADAEALAVGAVRGAFEFQGQKCSAASRLYVPRSIWDNVRDRMVAMIDGIKMGDVQDFRNFMGAVIDKKSFEKISGYIDHAKKTAKIVAGGQVDGARGFFVRPTLVETADPGYRLLCEEIFGPVLTVHVYDDAKWAETLKVVDSTSPYALTGGVFAQDRRAIVEA